MFIFRRVNFIRGIFGRRLGGWLAAGGLAVAGAGAAVPTWPTRAEAERLAFMAGPAEAEPLATTPVFTVDTSAREAVRQFYLAVATSGGSVPIEWTGSITTGTPGTTAEAFKTAVLTRINAMRALAGVPATVTFSSVYSAKAQQAALMFSANKSLSHTPPTTWLYYTAEGAEAAGNSNIALGENGVEAITSGYIGDSGSNNAAVGHRRWLLLPQTRTMGTGDVPATTGFQEANATWVIDGHTFDTRPATRTSYVAWPAAGYFPAPLVFPRWSFSYPNANFAGATVAMTRDGAPVAVQIEPLSDGAGENTLVWVYGGLDSSKLTTPTVTTDSVFHVTVSNVVIGGAAQSFQYDVRVFDPARTGSDTVEVALSGSTTPSIGLPNTYTATRPAFADTLEWRSLALDSSLPTYNAESGLAGLTATTTGTYSPRSTATVGAGTASYQLAAEGFNNQYLTAPEVFYAPPGTSPQLTFLSKLGYATVDQTARVQVSTNDGASWSDLFTQTGTSTGSAPTESTFGTRSVSLAGLVGQTFQIRFAYTFTSGTAFTQTTANFGWFLDNIALSGVQRVAAVSAVTATTATSFAFTPASGSAVGLQARGVLYGTYPMGWGPLLALNPTPPPSGPPATFANIATRAYCSTGNSVTIGGFVISGSASKRVLVRAVGPSLTAQGLAAGEVLRDPTIEVHDAIHNNDIVAKNDNWGANTNAADIASVGHTIGAADLLATDTTSSALLTSLAPGVYSFVVKGNGDSSGVVLLEIYDADTGGATATFSNIATRAYCTTGSGVTIGGFVISGQRAKQVLMRAVGPTLTTQGIGQSEVLLDPTIELHDAIHGNALVGTYDNWTDNAATLRTTAARVGATALAETDTTSAALLTTLQPGVYSFIVRGKNDASGIVLVEVYDAD